MADFRVFLNNVSIWQPGVRFTDKSFGWQGAAGDRTKVEARGGKYLKPIGKAPVLLAPGAVPCELESGVPFPGGRKGVAARDFPGLIFL
jgi:hypothetical protein